MNSEKFDFFLDYSISSADYFYTVYLSIFHLLFKYEEATDPVLLSMKIPHT